MIASYAPDVNVLQRTRRVGQWLFIHVFWVGSRGT